MYANLAPWRLTWEALRGSRSFHCWVCALPLGAPKAGVSASAYGSASPTRLWALYGEGPCMIHILRPLTVWHTRDTQ